MTDLTTATGLTAAANLRRGLLITFEGPEGSGKTTLIQGIAALLKEAGTEPLLIREPGGTEIGERIRNILLDRASDAMSAETELLLMVASRAQLVREKIKPALAAGRVILCDRFADASVAYQGYGRQLGEETVNRLNEVALGGLSNEGGVTPKLTFLCLLPPEIGQKRLENRATDRLDHESALFHARVYTGYEAMANSGDSRFQVIDASKTPEQMLAKTMGHFTRRLAEMEQAMAKKLAESLVKILLKDQ